MKSNYFFPRIFLLILSQTSCGFSPRFVSSSSYSSSPSLSSSSSSSGCDQNELVLYKLTFETHWSRQKFPKQYPENRPPAHWSKLIGMSHDESYILFRIGETANRDFKDFAETGKTFVADEKKSRHVFDEFSSSSIKTGIGESRVNFFVDGNHSMVSMAARIVPSPDWFVGVDSFSLCREGNWLDGITIEASPMDAGTDSGFTFTAPNWETEPPERITIITSRHPNHPASSFYYPNLKDLPVIATFRIIKKKLYRLSETAKIREENDWIRSKEENYSIRSGNRSTNFTATNHYKSKSIYRKKFKKQRNHRISNEHELRGERGKGSEEKWPKEFQKILHKE